MRKDKSKMHIFYLLLNLVEENERSRNVIPPILLFLRSDVPNKHTLEFKLTTSLMQFVSIYKKKYLSGIIRDFNLLIDGILRDETQKCQKSMGGEFNKSIILTPFVPFFYTHTHTIPESECVKSEQ